MLATQHPNGRKRSLGNSLSAEPSVASGARKPKKAAPFPLFHRIDEGDGRVAILVQDAPESIVAITKEGQWLNPWTKQPFKKLKDCRKSVGYFLRKGFWPGRVEGVPLP